MSVITTAEEYRADVDKYGLTRRKSKPVPTYNWLNLPTNTSLTGQELYLLAMRDEIERDIHTLARKQYEMPRGEYNDRMAELYSRKRVVAAVFNPYNVGTGSKGRPTLGCGWMRSYAQ